MPSFESIAWEDYMELLLSGCVLIAAFVIGCLLNHVVNRKLLQRVDTSEINLQSIFIRALRGIPILFCLATALYWIVDSVSFPASIAKIFSCILFTVIVFTIVRVLERTLSGLVNWKLSGSDSAVAQSTLLDNIFKVVIYGIGVLIILQYYGISITPIITAMGVGGMALALGLQETLANIFSGLQLIISKQLQVNDYVRLSTGEEGRVTDINWRYTTITPPNNGNIVVIPNKTIAAAITTNYSKPRDDIVVTIPVGVAYDSDLQFVEKVTLEVAKEVTVKLYKEEATLDDSEDDAAPDSQQSTKSLDDELKAIGLPAPIVRFHTFGDSSINFNVILHSSSFDLQYELKHEFIKALTDRYRKENIEIPFPIRTLIQKDAE